MTPTITAFETSPDGGKGLARDTRVRWALEEVGQPYEVRLVSFAALKEPAHLALHPFGQIPTYEEDNLALFETGAIVFHIAQQHAGLLPKDADARARAITWMFAALSTVEPPILDLSTAKIVEGDKPWAQERLPLVRDRIRARLGQLSARLADAEWLDGAFSAGDLLMVSVLLRLRMSGILDEYPNLAAYVARGEARPAYRRAFAAQLAVFTGRPPSGRGAREYHPVLMTDSASAVKVLIVDTATPELVEAFARLLPQLSTSASAPTLESLATIIAAPSNTVLIARDPTAGGRIVGTLTLVIFPIPTALRAWIEDVVVDNEARGRGVGEALTASAVNIARLRGAKTVDLTSRQSREAAHRLYQKAGFHVRDTSVYRYAAKPRS